MTRINFILTFAIAVCALNSRLNSDDRKPSLESETPIRASIERVKKHLKLIDDVEEELFNYVVRHTKGAGTPDSMLIVILRPNKLREELEQVHEFRNEIQKFSLRMVKVKSSSVSEPMGIVLYTGMKEGEMITSHKTLRYNGKTWTAILKPRGGTQ